jgi:two-component system NtrC family sensor kinase
MNLFALSGLLTGLSSLAMGIFVLSTDRSSNLKRLWFLFTGSVAVWGFGGMWIALERDEAMALLAWRVAFAFGVVWIPILFFHFVTTFCELRQRKLLLVNYAVGAVFFPLILVSPWFFGGVRFVFSSFYYSIPGSALFHLFFIWWVWLVIYAHYQVFKLFRFASGLKRNQYKYFFAAVSLGYFTGSLDYLPIYGIDFYPYGNFGIMFYPIIMTYAIVRYRLMDITVVLHKGLTYVVLLGLIFVPAYLAIVISERAMLASMPPLLVGTLVFACGLWVLFKSPREVAHITFGLVCLGACLWLFGFFMVYSSKEPTEALFWEKFVYVGVVYIPAFFYHFTVSVLRLKEGNRLIWACYLISTAFLSLVPTTYLLDGQYSYFWGHYPKAGVLHPSFLIYFAMVSGLSLHRLHQGYKAREQSAPLEARRLKYIFWSFVLGFGATLDFVQNYGFESYPMGYLFVSLWACLVTYAILKFQLLDISLTLTNRKFLPYTRPLALICSFYFLTLLLIFLFTGTTQYVLAGILVATFSLLADLLANLQKKMEKAIGKALFKKRYDAYETLTEFSKAMVAILDLQALNAKIMETLSKVMGIKKVSLFLLDKEGGYFFLAAGHGVDEKRLREVKILSRVPFVQFLYDTSGPILREELEHNMDAVPVQDIVKLKGILDTLSQIESELCIPLVNKEVVIGFLNLGHKSNREMYSEEDLELLSALGQNLAIALDNALLHEDVRRQKTLMRRTDRLRSLETIAGGFAHEVRNPLTSIKTFIQLTPERKDDPDFIGRFGSVVSEDVARIERLIQEILDYARYMEPKLTEENVNELVDSCVYFVGVKATSKSVTLEKDLAGNLPRVMLDRQQIKQVVLNLVLNAMDAMGEGGGLLVVKTRPLAKPAGESWVQIEVGDTGCGIAPDDLDHIFDPFYSTKHESEEREGTGLGLTIVHQIVQEHGGYVEVESTVGRGTTFFVNLPINPLKTQRRPREGEALEGTGPGGRG